jgi:hypothetical protein
MADVDGDCDWPAEQYRLRLATLREAADAVRWPLHEKDATHAVDDYRRGRWDGYQVVKRMLPPEPPQLEEKNRG